MKKIKSIKDGLIRRNTSLLKYAVKTGYTVLKNRDDPKKLIEQLVGVNPGKFVEDLSHYKGSIMKAGQLISQYGEYYLSDDINAKLKLLHSSTHFIGFESIKEQLDKNQIEHLEINEEPLAAASIGQVHQAIIKSNGTKVVLKIQYKGIDNAIKGDMVFLKMLSSTVKVFPKGVDVTDVFLEIEKVLKKEMDYKREARIVEEYREKLDDAFFHIPKIYNNFCTDKALCFEQIEGSPLSDINNLNLSQDVKDKYGTKIFELFLREIFDFKMVQTDAHGGNYYIEKYSDRLILLDFGACLKFEDSLIRFYQSFLKNSFLGKRDEFFKTLREFMEISGKYLEFDEDQLWDYVTLVSEPLRSSSYNWKTTNIHNVLFEEGKKLRSSLKFNAVPAHFIFLDRKVLGVFTLLRMIGSTVDMKNIFESVVIKK